MAESETYPPSIRSFSKRHRAISRLSESDVWLYSTSFIDDLLDDLPFCRKSKSMEHNLTQVQARTSTPCNTNNQHLFNMRSHFCVFSSQSKVYLDKSDDSGRWSIDTAEAGEISWDHIPSPRVSLEKSFDKAFQEDILEDSAYESAFSQCSDTLASCDTDTLLNGTISPESDAILETDDIKSSPETPFETMKKVLRQFTPMEPDCLIGRRMGRDTVDFISELRVRNMSLILRQIFKHLDSKDLCRVACVSLLWKSACDSDSLAKSRRLEEIKKHRLEKQMLQKENVRVRRSPRKKRGLTVGGILGNVQRAVDEQSTVKTRQSLQLLWQNEASKLRNDQELRKCPRCNRPARTLPAQDRAVCTQCLYDFCMNCQCVFHGTTTCSVTVRKKSKTYPVAGTQKSKKNLRRL